MKYLGPKQFAFALVAFVLVREWKKGYLKEIPALVRGLDWKPVLRVLALFSFLTVGVFFLDKALLDAVRSIGNAWMEDLIRFGGVMGKGITPWLFIMACYAVEELVRKPKGGAGLAFGCLLSSALTALICAVLKLIFLRARPYNLLGAAAFFQWEGFFRSANAFQSFPSGDVAVVAGAAAFLFYAARRGLFRWVFLLLPVLTALSRIDLNRHWPSDTLFSIGLGLAAAAVVRDFVRARAVRQGARP